MGWCYQSLMKTDRKANASGSTAGVALSSFMADGEWVGPPPRCFLYLQAPVLCCWQMRYLFSNIRSREDDVNYCAGVSSCSVTWNERVNLSQRGSLFLEAVHHCVLEPEHTDSEQRKVWVKMVFISPLQPSVKNGVIGPQEWIKIMF